MQSYYTGKDRILSRSDYLRFLKRLEGELGHFTQAIERWLPGFGS